MKTAPSQRPRMSQETSEAGETEKPRWIQWQDAAPGGALPSGGPFRSEADASGADGSRTRGL